MPYFSIIMPVYNGEKYIKKAVVSILKQSFYDFELIMINDGSTDDSAQICNTLARCDKRIIFISQKNQGALLARKAGIRIATGQYVLFLDCDDTFEADALKYIYKAVQETKADLVMFNYQRVDVYNSIKKEKKFLTSHKIYGGKELFLLSIRYFGLLNSLCTKAIRNKIIKNAFGVYHRDMSMAEDLLISLQIFKSIDKAIYIDKYLYNYVDNPNSSMHRVKLSFFSDYEFMYLEEIKMIREFGLSNILEKNFIQKFLIKIMADYFFLTFQKKLTFDQFTNIGDMLSKKAYLTVPCPNLNLGIIWNIPYKLYLGKKYIALYLYFHFMKMGYRIKKCHLWSYIKI